MSPDLLSRPGTSAYRAATAPHNSTTAQQPAVVAHPHSETSLLMRGKRRTGTRVTVLIDDLDIRVLDRHTGQLIRKLVLDPTRDYQPRGVKCGNSPENRQ